MTSQTGGFFVVRGGEYIMNIETLIQPTSIKPDWQRMDGMRPEYLLRTASHISVIKQLGLPTALETQAMADVLVALGTGSDGSFNLAESLLQAAEGYTPNIDAVTMTSLETTIKANMRPVAQSEEAEITVHKFGVDQITHVMFETAQGALLCDIPPAGRVDGGVVLAYQVAVAPYNLEYTLMQSHGYKTRDRRIPA